MKKFKNEKNYKITKNLKKITKKITKFMNKFKKS